MAERAAPSASCSPGFPQVFSSFLDLASDLALSGHRPVAPRWAVADASEAPPPLSYAAAAKVVSVGDLHGDLGKAVRAFRAAGVCDEEGRWTGGETVAVQVGDVMDRGGEEIQTLFWLERLSHEAARAGGKVVLLNGNHEIMAAAGDFRYATDAGFVEFARWAKVRSAELALKGRCGCYGPEGSAQEGRATPDAPAAAPAPAPAPAAASSADPAADPVPSVAPSAAPAPATAPADVSGTSAPWDAHAGEGLWRARLSHLRSLGEDGRAARRAALAPAGQGELSGRFFVPRAVVARVGSTLFAHGGVLPEHVERGLGAINADTHEWLTGGTGAAAAAAVAAAPVASLVASWASWLSDTALGVASGSGGGGGGGAGSAAASGLGGSSAKPPPPVPSSLRGRSSPIWSRHFGLEDAGKCDCGLLTKTLGMAGGVERLVVGHTIQSAGINSACGGRVLRVDVGLSQGCADGVPAALVIHDDTHVTRAVESGTVSAAAAAAAAAGRSQGSLAAALVALAARAGRREAAGDTAAAGLPPRHVPVPAAG